MKKKALQVFVWMLLGLWWLSGAAWAQPAGSQVLGTRAQLPNGLVWLFSEQSDLPLVTLQLLVKAGSLRDPQDKAGLANLTAQLLLSGTKSRSAAQIAQELDFLGARLKAQGNQDYATLSLTILKKDLEAGLNLFKDVLLNPVFAPAEVQRKVAQIQGALKSEEDEPMVLAGRHFDQALFGPFPYGHPVRGTHEGLAAISPEDLNAFHQAFYRPNNAILSVVGALTQEEARKYVQDIFGSWPQAPIPELKLPPIPPLSQIRTEIIDKDLTQANIILGNLGISRSNPDFYAVQVMNYILGGGGFSSRLLDEIRVNRGLAYSVSSAFSPGLEPGPFMVSLETKNPSAREAIDQVLVQMGRIRQEPVTAQELKDAKSYLIGSFPQKMDSMSKRAWLLAYVELYGLGLDYPWKYPDIIEKITPTQVQEVAGKYLHPEKYLLVVVGKQAAMPSLSGEPPRKSTEEKKQ